MSEYYRNTKVIFKNDQRYKDFAHDIRNDCVVTNGCFDVLHPGHIEILQRLSSVSFEYNLHPVVALNSDSSIKENKGNDRPILDLLSRIKMLSCLNFQFSIIVFNEKTPHDLMNELNPVFVIKGADYSENDVIKGPNSKVILVPLAGDFNGPFSTSRLIR